MPSVDIIPPFQRPNQLPGQSELPSCLSNSFHRASRTRPHNGTDRVIAKSQQADEDWAAERALRPRTPPWRCLGATFRSHSSPLSWPKPSPNPVDVAGNTNHPVERDWWIQTHWEDNDCRMVDRNLVACPILRDMISKSRSLQWQLQSTQAQLCCTGFSSQPESLRSSTTWSLVTTWCEWK